MAECRVGWVVVLAISLILLSALLATLASAQEPSLFVQGDWIVVRGRLKECPRWKNRIVDIELLDSDQPVELLGLGSFVVVSHTSSDVLSELRQAYRTVTGNVAPPITVERVPANPQPSDILWDAFVSLRAIAEKRCRYRDDPGKSDADKIFDVPIDQLERYRRLG